MKICRSAMNMCSVMRMMRTMCMCMPKTRGGPGGAV